MADEKKHDGLNGPVNNPHAGNQPNAQWQNILAGAAAGMAGQPNPYLAQMQAQHAQQQQALMAAKNSQAQQLANFQNTAQAHMQDPAVQQAAMQQAQAHAGPAPGGLAGNPLAPNAAQQMQQMGAQAGAQMTPDQLKQQQIAMSDERLKENVDRTNMARQMRRFLDSFGEPESKPKAASYDVDSLAGRALRNG